MGRDADAPFRRGSNLFELTWQASERERGGESGSDKEMFHPRRRLTGSSVPNNGQSLLSIVRRDKQDRKIKPGHALIYPTRVPSRASPSIPGQALSLF